MSGLQFLPWVGHVQEAVDVFLPLSVSPFPLSLKEEEEEEEKDEKDMGAK